MADYFDWVGKSGTVYRYWTGDIKNPFAVPANYAFVKWLPNGNPLPLYFGEAGDLKARMPGHEKLSEAIRLGGTHFMTHVAPAEEQTRRAEERDLIQYSNPPLNIQHKQVR